MLLVLGAVVQAYSIARAAVAPAPAPASAPVGLLRSIERWICHDALFSLLRSFALERSSLIALRRHAGADMLLCVKLELGRTAVACCRPWNAATRLNSRHVVVLLVQNALLVNGTLVVLNEWSGFWLLRTGKGVSRGPMRPSSLMRVNKLWVILVELDGAARASIRSVSLRCGWAQREQRHSAFGGRKKAVAIERGWTGEIIHFIPLPGSSVRRAIFSKALLRLRLWRIEFCQPLMLLSVICCSPVDRIAIPINWAYEWTNLRMNEDTKGGQGGALMKKDRACEMTGLAYNRIGENGTIVLMASTARLPRLRSCVSTLRPLRPLTVINHFSCSLSYEMTACRRDTWRSGPRSMEILDLAEGSLDWMIGELRVSAFSFATSDFTVARHVLSALDLEMTSTSEGVEGSVSASDCSFASVPSVSSRSLARAVVTFLRVAARPLEVGASLARALLREVREGVAMDSGVSASDTSAAVAVAAAATSAALRAGLVRRFDGGMVMYVAGSRL
ncbi:hypothetical protein KCU92_g258, partial [Aureobasidium melanogenum]